MKLTANAAVAIIISSVPCESVLLLRRPQHPLDPWSGHFSFPGGRKSSSDKDLLQTCLRETYEESGIVLQEDKLSAVMPLAKVGNRTAFSMLVQPFLFHLNSRPEVCLDTQEIQSSSWLETRLFRKKSLHIEAEVLPKLNFPAFPYGDYFIWGFTYNLLCNVLINTLESCSVLGQDVRQ